MFWSLYYCKSKVNYLLCLDPFELYSNYSFTINPFTNQYCIYIKLLKLHCFRSFRIGMTKAFKFRWQKTGLKTAWNLVIIEASCGVAVHRFCLRSCTNRIRETNKTDRSMHRTKFTKLSQSLHMQLTNQSINWEHNNIDESFLGIIHLNLISTCDPNDGPHMNRPSF